jgi:hypothetical protein
MVIDKTYDWVKEIIYNKSPTDSFSEEDWNKFEPYIINRFLSSYYDYIELINYIQTLNISNKKMLYDIYKELIPKKKVYIKFPKNNNKKDNSSFKNNIKIYYNWGEREYLINENLILNSKTYINKKLNFSQEEIKKSKK